MKFAIIGFGQEGKVIFSYLRRNYPKSEIWILDINPQLKVPKGVYSRSGSKYLSRLDEFDTVFRSPGIPWELEELRKARRQGVKISSQADLFLRQARGAIIGITGTKGKGTTSTLLYKMLIAGDKKAYLAGNIGKPMLDLLPKLRQDSYTVLELSSFQLQGLGLSPRIAIVLDIFPDHLENIKTARHGTHRSFKEYISAKANIARYQKRDNHIFFFAQKHWSKWVARQSEAKRHAIDPDKFKLFTQKELKMPGRHNFDNAVMAASVASFLGIPENVVRSTALKFKALEHRLEFVRKLNGVKFYNDSASTNPHTAAAAVRAFLDVPAVLIAGGKDKNLDYRSLVKAFRSSIVKFVVLFGENKKKIATTIMESRIRKQKLGIRIVKDLRSAVKLAYKLAKPNRGNVIFSPGSSSFDMFSGYKERGKKFKTIVKNL